MANRIHAFALLPVAAALALAACGGADNEATPESANHISEDPFGATGAPGSDMTDNGLTDGSNGMANAAEPENGVGTSAGVEANAQ